jgi:hypothetical protein
MSQNSGYSQGGDAQAIQNIAKSYYGAYAKMFEVHGWPERSKEILPAVQKRVVETYGGVRAFEGAHARQADLMFPMEAIYSEPPNVWLTSFYGFRPETWGFVGFTEEGRRTSFLKRSKPGVLVAIYAAGKAPKDMLGSVVGVLQCTHEIGPAEQYCAPAIWAQKQKDPAQKERWNFGVRAMRAWRITPESRMDVRDFAPNATASGAWEHIGAQGEPLTRKEALNILKLDLQEVGVYGQAEIVWAESRPALQILAPSKAGPVSTRPHVVREAEGPKHLYILRLKGDANAFLGQKTNGRSIIKVGMSGSPTQRCDDHNRALPQGVYRWEILNSGVDSGFDAYPTSGHALAGERAIQKHLCDISKSQPLGGEFFLASPEAIHNAWLAGNKIAREFKK